MSLISSLKRLLCSFRLRRSLRGPSVSSRVHVGWAHEKQPWWVGGFLLWSVTPTSTFPWHSHLLHIIHIMLLKTSSENPLIRVHRGLPQPGEHISFTHKRPVCSAQWAAALHHWVSAEEPTGVTTRAQCAHHIKHRQLLNNKQVMGTL